MIKQGYRIFIVSVFALAGFMFLLAGSVSANDFNDSQYKDEIIEPVKTDLEKRLEEGIGCPEFGPAKISVAQFTGRLYQNQSKTAFDLARAKSKKYDETMPQKIGNMGEAVFRPDIVVNVKTYPGMGCVIVDEITVKIFVDHFLDIAKEHAEGGCMHTELYGLEIELMQQDEDIINEDLEAFRLFLKEGIGKKNVYGPISGADMNSAIIKKKKEIERMIRNHLQILQAKLFKARKESDLLEFYNEIETDCMGPR